MVVKNDKTLSPFAAPAEARSKWRQALPQILAVCVKNVLLLGFGMTLGFPTILIPSLSSNNEGEAFHLGQEAISWIGSINLICVPVGCLLSGAVTEPIGRKRAMQLSNVPFVIAWLLFYFSNNVWQVFLALSLTGLTGGLLEAPTLTYVAEITQAKLRGILSATAALGVLAGILIEFFLGSFLSWKNVALISSLVPIVSFTLIMFLPESPHWLITANKDEEAKKSLAWLRGWVKTEEIEEEFNEMKNHINNENEKTFLEVCKLFTKRAFLLPHLIVTYAFFLSQGNGTTTIQVYAVKIFRALRAPIDEYIATTAMGVSELLGAIVSTCCVYYTGKRKLSFISLAFCGLCFLIVATEAQIGHIYNIEQQTDEPLHHEKDWLPMCLLIGATFFSHMGIKLLPWLLIGEVYPNEIRAHASGIAGGTGYIFAFICNKSFFLLINTITLPGTFWLFSGVCFSGIVVLYFILPETEGRTLFEITEYFANSNKIGSKIPKNQSKKEEINKGYQQTEMDSHL